MKRSHALLVLLTMVLSSALTSLGCYEQARQDIDQDIRQALALTMQEEPADVITADTIRTFNSHLQLARLRGHAVLSLGTRSEAPTLQAHCPTLTVIGMSDQRPALALASLALVWAAGCVAGRRRPVSPMPTAPNLPAFGGLAYSAADGRFLDLQGQEVRFTPMQQQLMELLFRAPRHRMGKADICEALWPKKDDASETLYTLVRRLRPTLEAHTSLTIEAERGRAYQLTVRQI